MVPFEFGPQSFADPLGIVPGTKIRTNSSFGFLIYLKVTSRFCPITVDAFINKINIMQRNVYLRLIKVYLLLDSERPRNFNINLEKISNQ